MILQTFIREHNDWEELLSNAPYNLKITRGNGYVMFKYDQISSDFSLPIVRQARGIIFREKDWDCVCHAFDKFFNYSEPNCATLDWEQGVSVQEKIDGSIMKLWYDNREWHLSTNSTIDAHNAMAGDISFYDLFEKALKTYGFDSIEHFALVNQLIRGETYIFELATCENRVVIPYEGYHIYFLGRRDYWQQEWPTYDLGVELPKIYNLTRLQDVVNAAQHLLWDEEGYVCVDKHYNRCKIKSPAYVEAHYNRGNGVITTRKLIHVILEGEEDEFSVYCSDYVDQLNIIKSKMSDLMMECLRAGEKFANSASRKELAFAIKDLSPVVKGYCFYAYEREHPQFAEYTQNWSPERWEKVL